MTYTLAASQTFPALFCPSESRPTSGARPLPQTRPFWLNQPAARQLNKFSESTHRGDRTQDLWTVCRVVNRFGYRGRGIASVTAVSFFRQYHLCCIHEIWCNFSRCTSLTSFFSRRTSKIEVVFAHRHHHHWPSVVHSCRLSATELFHSPLSPCLVRTTTSITSALSPLWCFWQSSRDLSF